MWFIRRLADEIRKLIDSLLDRSCGYNGCTKDNLCEECEWHRAMK